MMVRTLPRWLRSLTRRCLGPQLRSRVPRRRRRILLGVERLELRELLDASSALLGDLAQLRSDVTTAAISFVNAVQPSATNTATPVTVQNAWSQVWSTLTTDWQRTWQDVANYEMTILNTVAQEFDALFNDLGIHLPGQSPSTPPPAANTSQPSPTHPSEPLPPPSLPPSPVTTVKPLLSPPPSPPPSPPITVQFSEASVNVSEANVATLSVTLSATPTQNVTVNWATSDGTATAGKDYTSSGGTLTWPANTALLNDPFYVETGDDNAVNEPTETFYVTLSSPTNATLGNPSTLAVNITEDSDGGSGLPPASTAQPTCNCGCPGEPGGLLQPKSAGYGATVAQSTNAPVRYADGVATIATTDLHSDGFGFPWGQTRTWSNGPGYATGSDNGSGWVDTYTPHLLQADGSTKQYPHPHRQRHHRLLLRSGQRRLSAPPRRRLQAELQQQQRHLLAD